jgi:hypothetical protein
MSFSNTLEDLVLDHVFGGATLTQPSTIYIGLSTADPGEDASGNVEVFSAGNGYARYARSNDTSFWRASASSVKQNSAEIAFSECLSAWGTITHVGIWTHPTSTGAAVFYGSQALGTSKSVEVGDNPRFQTDSLQITLD